MIGIPTPYVLPWLFSRIQSSDAEIVWLGFRVLNELVAWVCLPVALAAVAVTVYEVDGDSAHFERHSVCAALNDPGSCFLLPALTVTVPSLPSAALTSTPRS